MLDGRAQLEVLVERPVVNILEKGSTSFLVSSEYYGCCGDITRDELSPWTGVYYNFLDKEVKTSTKISLFCVYLDRGIYKKCNVFHIKNKICPNSSKLKIFINYHPRYSVRRKIAVILNNKDEMETPVFHEFCSEEKIEHEPSRPRILPSVSQTVGSLLERRTTAQTKALLSNMNIDITSSQIVTKAKKVGCHIKNGRGRRAPSDISKLLDLFATSSSQNADVQPCNVQKIDGKVTFTQIVGFKVALKHFCTALPTDDDFAAHLDEINFLSTCTKEEAQKSFELILRSVTPSRSILNIGALLQIDTTFSLSSGEYVTIALGSCDMFQNKSSGKNSVIILGIMIHTTKSMNNHEAFARYLTKKFEEYGKNKVLPGLIFDGEPGFLPYTTGSFFSKSVKLRCDVHIIDNIKRLFSPGEKREAQTLTQFLYGKVDQNPAGKILKKGALVAFNYESYSRKFDRLLNDYPEKVKKWLCENKQSLFEHNSLISKLRAGQTQQFMSTNLIENKNGEIKQLIPRAVPAHKVIEIFCMMSESEIKERINAILSKSDNLTTHFVINSLDWNRMSNCKKMHALSSYGLEEAYFESKFFKYPSWLIEGDGSLPVEKKMEFVEKTIVHPSSIDSNIFFTSTEASIAKVEKTKNSLICYDSQCKKSKNCTLFLCCHSLAVFLKISEVDKEDVINGLKANKEKKTIKQVQAEQLRPEDGSKFSKRKGGQNTRTNNTRDYDILSSTLETSDFIFLSSDSEDDQAPTKRRMIDSDDDY